MSITTTVPIPFLTKGHMPKTEAELKTFEAVLRPCIQNDIYKFNLIHWRGGEQSLVEDVLHETYARALTYAQHAENGTAPSISSFEALCKTIAKHYILDLRRKDKRLVISIDAIPLFTEHQYVDMFVDPTDDVVEDMMVYSKMLLVSKAVKDFTPKLKKAMLIHLANLEDFDDEQPHPLERAMWTVGIPLREYRCELPKNPILRRRHSTLVCLGLKTLRQTFSCPPHQSDNAA
ncbi:MAG: hypothetical protein NVS4B12_15000 [Ktedonobacteraceae bacterium]